MIHIDPETRAKFAKFRKNKIAWRSLLLLSFFFLASLPAELLFNNRPILMSIDGEWYSPVLFSYTYKDLGGEVDAPVLDYNSDSFKHFMNGDTLEVNLDVLYPESAPLDPDTPEGKAVSLPDGPLIAYHKGPSRDTFTINPPFKHSYRSFYTSQLLDRQVLVSPFATVRDGKEVPGGGEEGHWLGTDKTGKDVLARLVYGFRLSILFGLFLAITSTIVGSVIGGIQGYLGGLVDLLGQRCTEIGGSMPRLLLLIILSDFIARLGGLTVHQHLFMLFLILNLTLWMGMAAHMRAQFLRARNLDYVKAAKCMGVSDFRIMFNHILPNSLTPIITFLPFSISRGILALVSLDFLGFGLKYPAPSLGELLAQGQENLEAWWIMVPTFIMLASMMILLTFIGDGVRNVFDPRHKA
jgi:ABC-type microcin C transport system permease subunit YejE